MIDTRNVFLKSQVSGNASDAARHAVRRMAVAATVNRS